MNSFSRVALIPVTFVLLAGSASGKTRLIAPPQTLSIRLYDDAQAPAQMLHAASDQASYLLRAARIRTSWQRPLREPPEDQGTDMTAAAFQQPDARGYLVVRLMTRTPATILPGALGYALPLARKGAHVLIFYDRVETLAHNVNESIYIVLGHAIAHEIGHVLLGSNEHASGGLMQGRWTPATWHLASLGLLSFTPREAERMDAGLHRFQPYANPASEP